MRGGISPLFEAGCPPPAPTPCDSYVDFFPPLRNETLTLIFVTCPALFIILFREELNLFYCPPTGGIYNWTNWRASKASKSEAC